LAELQKDPITRKDFLGFGVLSAIVGAILTIPPIAFVLGPIINVNSGQTDVSQDWFKVGSIEEIPEEEPKLFFVNFPVDQVYAGEDVSTGGEDIQKQQPRSQRSAKEFVVENAIYVSWRREILEGGRYGESLRPAFLDEGISGSLTEEQRKEAEEALNVLSNSCAHLGCPVRWIVREGEGELLCPCHGGIYNINGEYVAGPPPRGLYKYTNEVREDGNIYVKHEFDTGGDQGFQEPFVI
jgi:Rieske Fe-S protein